MAAFWFKAMVFVFIVQAVMGILMTPTFNIFDKHYPNPNMYFNKTNMSVSTMTQSQADMFYGRSSNVTGTVNMTGTFGNLISSWSEGNVIGILVNVLTLAIGFILLIISAFWNCYTFVYIQITTQFGMEYAPWAAMLQGALDLAFTYTGWQIITGRSDKLLNS